MGYITLALASTIHHAKFVSDSTTKTKTTTFCLDVVLECRLKLFDIRPRLLLDFDRIVDEMSEKSHLMNFLQILDEICRIAMTDDLQY